MVKNPPSMQDTQVRSLGQENPLEEGMASHLSILAWWIPWTEEPGGLQSMGLQRVRHDWVTCPTKSWIFIWWIDFLIIIKWPYLSLVDHFQFTLIHGPNIPGSYAILLFTTLDFTSITSHIHSWMLFLLWLCLFILSEVISLLIQ